MKQSSAEAAAALVTKLTAAEAEKEAKEAELIRTAKVLQLAAAGAVGL